MHRLYRYAVVLLCGAAAILLMVSVIGDVPADTRNLARYVSYGLMLAVAGIMLIRERINQNRRKAYLSAFTRHESLAGSLPMEELQAGLTAGRLTPDTLLVSGEGKLTRPLDPRGLQWVVLDHGVTGLGRGVIPATAAEVFLPDTVTDLDEGAFAGSQTILRTVPGAPAAEYARTHGLMCEVVQG